MMKPPENSPRTFAARRFARSRAASAAVEFAMISPVLVLLLLGIIDVGVIAYERVDMFSAVRSGAQYFMGGGSDLDRAGEIVRLSWTQAPAGAQVSVDRVCQCQQVENACSLPCSDGSPPVTYARIVLSAEVDGIFKKYGATINDTVRVR